MSETREEGLPEEEFSELLSAVGAAAPLIKGLFGKTEEKKEGADPSSPAAREALLSALRPYLSPARRETLDTLRRVLRMSDALRAMR